jgi:hypothetical protein
MNTYYIIHFYHVNLGIEIKQFHPRQNQQRQ